MTFGPGARLNSIHALLVVGFEASLIPFNRNAIVPSLAVSPNDACAAEAGSLYVTSLACGAVRNESALAASAITMRRMTIAIAAPCFAFTSDAPVYMYTTFMCASPSNTWFDPTFSAWIIVAPGGSCTLAFRM